MPYKLLKELTDLEGKRVLVRADLDVPLNDNLQVTNDIRLKELLPTVEYLTNKGAKVILLGHKGRPREERVFELSLKPIIQPLSNLLNKDVLYSKNCIGIVAKQNINSMANGEVLVLENTRFEKGETSNSEKLSGEFADLADIYVNEAFATSHRAHASTYGVATIMKNKAIGLNFQKETEVLSTIMQNAKKPFLIIIAGSKISTKIGVLEHLIPKADQIIIGGAMANTFLKAKNYNIGNSMYEHNCVDMAREILTTAGVTGCRVQLPHGVTVADELKEFIATRSVSINKIKSSDMILDIGNRTLDVWQKVINEAGTILWNGPIGAFEKKPFDEGTTFLAKAIAESPAYTVIGGGDTLAAVQNAKIDIKKFSYVSTAGGAMLEFLEGKKLPALEALEN